jgi:preprotein translocase subunit Sss1
MTTATQTLPPYAQNVTEQNRVAKAAPKPDIKEKQ